jgi:hypothetical protein
MSDAVKITVRDGICHVEMARPEKKNALTAAMYQSMADALAAAEKDPAVRVILISGSGGSFTAGNDLADFLATPPMDDSAPVFRFIKGFAARKALCRRGRRRCRWRRHHHAAALRPGLCRRQRQIRLPFANLGLTPEAASSCCCRCAPACARRRTADAG